MGLIPGIQGYLTSTKQSIYIHINKIQDKYYMIFSKDAQKAFSKIQYPSVIKSSQ